jgi:hypothetical protein
MIRLRYALYLSALCFFSCKKPYLPPASSTVNSFLVVEGAINSGSDSTIIKLSKTVKLDDTTTVNPLLGATVTVESDQNDTWQLIDHNNHGKYASPSLNLPQTAKYRLRIKTNNGSQYLSDFIAVKPTPPIDSIGYNLIDGVVKLYVNTHDPANNTHYYRWEYEETWQFKSYWQSIYVYDPITKSIVDRPRDKGVYFCFGNDQSSHILVNSTAKLSQDVVYQSPLTDIPLTSEKVETKYSILVRQYALPLEAYQFYQNVQKNTEDLGSIFDAQPTQLNGNIHNLTNPAEPVIGYLTVTNVQTKRIFIPTSDLTSQILTIYPSTCILDTASYNDSRGVNTIAINLLGLPITNEPLWGIGPSLPPQSFAYSTAICVDCTIRGFREQPSFWR